MPQKNDMILSLNQEAQELKRRGLDVTNGAIGMMYLDDGHLPVSSSVRQLLAKHTEDQDLVYSSVAGSPDYHDALRHWFLGEAFEEAAQTHHFLSVATPGGTGAVCLAFAASRGAKNAVVVPSLGWPNYVGIAKGFGLDLAFYDLFEEDHFNLGGIKKQIRSLLIRYDHLSLLINDPCQNPTGYSLSAKEWAGVVDFLGEEGVKGHVDLIIDAAYIDFAPESYRSGMINAIKRLAKETLCYFCFSFSKTLSFYGLRIGALSVYGDDGERLARVYDGAVMEARALWSVPNHMAMNAVAELLNEKTTNASLREEVDNNRKIVAKRASIFFEEAKEVGLHPYPYECGFFVTLKAKDAFATCLALKEKRIFLAPVKDDALRIALCSLPTAKIPGLAEAIKEAAHE
jgi:aromatic-amino-acid transaminase